VPSVFFSRALRRFFPSDRHGARISALPPSSDFGEGQGLLPILFFFEGRVAPRPVVLGSFSSSPPAPNGAHRPSHASGPQSAFFFPRDFSLIPFRALASALKDRQTHFTCHHSHDSGGNPLHPYPARPPRVLQVAKSLGPEWRLKRTPVCDFFCPLGSPFIINVSGAPFGLQRRLEPSKTCSTTAGSSS